MRIPVLRKILVAALMLISFTMRSQTYSNKVSSVLSFTGGLTSSNLIGDTIKFRSGILFSGGLSYSVMINDRLNVGLDVLYTGKAFKYDSPIIKFRYFYIDIPLYAQICLSENIRINAGLQYSVAANSKMVTIDPSDANGVNVQTVSSIKPVDYGVLGGLEFDVSDQIGIGARYSISSSVFFQSDEPNFGVFALSLKYSPIKTYKVFFRKKEEK